MNKNIQRGLVLVGVLVASGASMAASTPPDLTPLSGAVDVSTVVVAILAIAATLAGLYLAMSGAKKVLGMIRGA